MQAFSTIDKAALSCQLNKTISLDQNKIYTEFGHLYMYMYIIFESWKVTKKWPFLKQESGHFSNNKIIKIYHLRVNDVQNNTVFMYHNYHLTSCHQRRSQQNDNSISTNNLQLEQ